MSSESDQYEDSDSMSHPRSRYQTAYRQRPRMSTTSSLSSRVGQITKSLQDTNRNINAVDGLLEDYKDINEKQSKAIERLRENLAKSTEQLREERMKKRSSYRETDSRTLHASDLETGGGDVGRRYNPTSPLREYRVSGGASTRDYHNPPGVRFEGPSEEKYPVQASGGASTRDCHIPPGVRFEGPSEEVHELHQAVRDLSSEQLRLGAELNGEIQKRNRFEHDTNRRYQELNESITRTPKKTSQENSQTTDRVEQRLREIQNDLRQQRLEQEAKERYDLDRRKETEERKQTARERESLAKEKEQILTEVKHMVSSQRRDEEKVLREQLLQAESDKARLAAELSASQRRLEQSEGSKAVLEQKIDKLSHDFHHSKDEHRSLQDKLMHYQQALEEEGIPLSKQQRREQRIKAPILSSSLPESNHPYAQQQQEIERVKMENEIERMRQQLAEASRLKDEDDLRAQLQKTDQQKEQMVQHINTLSRELEDKDSSQKKLLQQLQDMTETLAGSERQRKIALSQLEDLQRRLRDSSSVSESESLKVQEQSRQLEQSEKKRADLKAKAQDVIRQWKVKCKRLEKELDEKQQTSSYSSERLDGTLRENENLKSQSFQMSHRMENLQREMQDILEKRAEQDEQLRLKDVEIGHLKSAKIELDQEVRDARSFIDKVDSELKNQQSKLSSFNEERLKQDEKISGLKSSNQQLEKENKRIQEELSKYVTRLSEQVKLNTQEAEKRQDLELKLRQSEAECEAGREEAEILTRKLNEERDSHEEMLSRYKMEHQAFKEREGRDIQDLTRKMKRDRVESEAEIHTLKIEVAEQKANSKSLRKQLERQKEDFEKGREDVAKLEAENNKLRRRYDKMKANYESQLQLTEVGDNRASHLNNQIQVLQETFDKQLIDYESCLRGVAKEVDALLAVVCRETSEESLLLSNSPSKSQLEGHPDRWLADLKTKLQWAKEEVRNLILKKKKLKSELNRSRSEAEGLLQDHHLEKSMIESEFEKQGDALEQLAASNRDLEIQNEEKNQEVSSLQRQVANLEAHIGKSASLMEQSMLAFPDGLPQEGSSLTQDLDRLQELQMEKERINERYLKYQGTVTMLQRQLEEAKHLTSS